MLFWYIIDKARSAGVAERWYMQAEPGVIKDTGEKK